MAEFIRACKVDELPDPGKLVVEVGDRFAVLFRVDGRFYALEDCCTHDGGPLGEGDLSDHAVACPRHGARFDIRTGRALSMPATQPTRVFEVKVEDGEVFIRDEGA